MRALTTGTRCLRHSAYVCILVVCDVSAQTTERQDNAWRNIEPAQQNRAQWKVPEAPEANRSSVRIFGVQDQQLEAVTELVSLLQDKTPYVAKLLVGTPLWHSEIKSVELKLPSSPSGFRDSYRRTFDLFLDPTRGHIVKIRSRWPDGQPPMPEELNSDQAAEQMYRSGHEKYHGLPDNPPAVTFMAALDSIQRGGGNPLIAKQIIGDYVMWSRIGKWESPRAVWAITLRGVPPLHARAGDNASNSAARYIVDSTTGEYLCASNTPHPDSFSKPRTETP